MRVKSGGGVAGEDTGRSRTEGTASFTWKKARVAHLGDGAEAQTRGQPAAVTACEGAGPGMQMNQDSLCVILCTSAVGKLLAVDDHWGKKGQFSLGAWPLVSCPVQVDGTTAMGSTNWTW